MKRCQKIWAGPSVPLIWTKSKRTAVFFLRIPSFSQQCSQSRIWIWDFVWNLAIRVKFGPWEQNWDYFGTFIANILFLYIDYSSLYIALKLHSCSSSMDFASFQVLELRPSLGSSNSALPTWWWRRCLRPWVNFCRVGILAVLMWLFLAVQDSSLSDIVCLSFSLSQLAIRA